MASRMKASLVCDPLTMAVWQRKFDKWLIVHWGQGVEYPGHQYR